MGKEIYCPVEHGWQGLSEALSKAVAGDTVRLGSGTYTGQTSLTIPESVQLIGNGESILINAGSAPTVLVDKANVRIHAVGFQATPAQQTLVHIHCTQGVEISGCTLEGGGTANCGVLADRSLDVKISDSTIRKFSNKIGLRAGLLVFESTTGSIRDNDLSEGSCGIVLARSLATQGIPSIADIERNRCHENEADGIAFCSSNGRAEGNECWGSRTGSGIVAFRGKESLDTPSQIELIGNRCYDNELEGIAFLSSNGRAEGNECWGSRTRCGILAQRSEVAPDAPSQVALIRNHCHDNELNGITFLSSNGRAEDNECWGSRKLGGISIERDSISPHAPSEVELIGNRCHDNKNNGITFLSSNGYAEGNECWGSRTQCGIVVLRAKIPPNAPSQAELISNRCYDNAASGIVFESGTGRAEGNECWHNGRDTIELLGGASVAITSHHVQPSQDPATLRTRSWSHHPLGAWLLVDKDGVSGAESLASYLWSGGCRDCFKRFWNPPENDDTAGATLTVAKEQRAPAYNTDFPAASGNNRHSPTAARCYRVRREAAGDAPDAIVPRRIASEDPFWSSKRRPGDGLASLSALLTKFGTACGRALRGKKGRDGYKVPFPRWAIGLVSANEPALDAWLSDAQARLTDVTSDLVHGSNPPEKLVCIEFDMLGLGTVPAAENPIGLIDQKFLAGKSVLQRIGLWVEAILFMPALQGVTLFAIWALAAFGLFAYQTQFEFWTEPINLETLSKHWMDFTAGFAANRMKYAAMGLSLILLLVLLINRVMPSPLLRIPLQAFWDWLKEMEVPGLNFVAKFFSGVAKRAAKWQAWIRPLTHSDSSRRLWIRRRVYGRRWFEGLRWQALPPVLLVVRNIDVPPPSLRQEMRELLEACPRRQGVVLIIQMHGMSMLVSGFVDVWFDADCQDTPPELETFIVHDLDSARIPVAERPQAENIKGDFDAIANRLGTVLGWPVGDRSDLVNSIAHPRPSSDELLPAMILGATPHMHMQIRRPIVTKEIYAPELRALLTPYAEVLNSLSNDNGMSAVESVVNSAISNVEHLEDCAKNADGLLLVDLQDHGRRMTREWIGRVGYRVHLAGALRALFSEGNGSADLYLAKLVACGELYQLTTLPDVLLKGDWQRAPLHAEAACFLMMDRLSLAPVQDFPQLKKAWQDLVEYLRKPLATCGNASQVARLCMAVLNAKALYLKDVERSEEAQLKQVINHPFAALPTEATTVWVAFAQEIQTTLQALSRREPATALQLMNAKLAQDWVALPEGFKEALRAQIPGLRRHWLRRMGHATSTDELYALAIQMREQPALLTATLGAMASASTRQTNPGDLEKIADAMMALRGSVERRTDDIQIPILAGLNSKAAIEAARHLLIDESWRSKLCEALRAGEVKASELALAASKLDTDVDCIALGVHGQLHSIMLRCLDKSPNQKEDSLLKELVLVGA